MEQEWFPDNANDCEKFLILNKYLGADKSMSLGSILVNKIRKGAKYIVINYKPAARAVAAIIKLIFEIVFHI